jgi:hypothetical protein
MGLHAANPYKHSPAGNGELTTSADRIYDDGFVSMDPATDLDSLTWYWGYDTASQYDAAADTLSFHLSGGRQLTRTITQNDAANWDEDTDSAGVAVTAGRRLGTLLGLPVEICAGLQGAWGMGADVSGRLYSEAYVEKSFTTIDTYALDGVVPDAAPYVGTYDGPGALIPNTPTYRTQQVTGTRTWSAATEVDMDVDLALYECWIGPRVSAEITQRVGAFICPSLSLVLVDMEAERDEEFSAQYRDGSRKLISQWRDSASEQDVLFAVGLNAGLRVGLGGAWHADLSGSYSWATDDAEVAVGPNTVIIDPSGYTAAIQIGRDI